MPILNIQVEGSKAGKDNGAQIEMPPSQALMEAGPRLPVAIAPTDEHFSALANQGKPLPAPVNGLAMIDTGAARTAVDVDAAKQAGLIAVDSGVVHSATHENARAPVYMCKFLFPGWSMQISPATVLGLSLASQGLVALIGRDALSQCIFVYNGSDGRVSLAL